MATASRSDNPFWAWSVAAWQRPGVEAACLQLQDIHGLFVPAFLFACWSARQDIALDRTEIERLALTHWQADIIDPLRKIRRTLRAGEVPVTEVCQDLQRSELQLEQCVMGLMFEAFERIAASRSSTGVSKDPADLLRHNLEVLGIELPGEAQVRLLAIGHELLGETAAGA